MIGKTIGRRYRIDALIGSGGMAVVYRATDLRSKRVVALKVLKEQYSQNAEFLGRFDREAVASAKMRHPNIVSLLDTGDEDGLRYLVIEYVQGMTLKELVREQGKLSPDEAIRITLCILSALEHAHEKNIIHRDIKPQNILVDDRGHIKIADFGIAKMTDTATLTSAENSVMGSVHYFSPEQAKGKPADASSDLYSTGVVLYEMLTGSVPFDGETPYAVARQHIEALPKPVGYYVPGTPFALEEILVKALSKERNQRYESAAQMSADVRKARKQPKGGFVVMRPSQRTGEQEPANGQQRRRKRKPHRSKYRRIRMVLSLAMGVLVLIALGVVGYRLINDALTHTAVPDVVDMEEALASRTLTRSGLGVTVMRGQSEAPLGQVYDQSPQPGERLERSQSVTIYVSQGTGKITVPDVQGLPEEDAVQALNDAGLEVGDEVVDLSEMAPGIVFRQMPEAGAVVDGDAVVDIYISGGLVVVPDLKTLTQREAEEQLRVLGLGVGRVSAMAVDDAEKDGQVQSQFPAVGERVFPGTTVDLSVAKADTRPYKAEVNVTVQIPPTGAHVRVTLEDANGEESDQYAAMHAMEGENTIKVPLRSDTPGETTYRVYVDNQLKEEAQVMLR